MPELSEDQRERFWEAIACTFLDTTTYSEQQEGECEASIASLIAEAQREAAQAVLDAVEAVQVYEFKSVARVAAARYGAGTAAGGDGR